MTIVEFSKNFLKSYGKRVKSNNNLKNRVADRIDLFRQNRANLVLKDHQLTGPKKNFRSFSVNGDIRIIYYLKSENIAVFTDIGSHNQVY